MPHTLSHIAHYKSIEMFFARNWMEWWRISHASFNQSNQNTFLLPFQLQWQHNWYIDNDVVCVRACMYECVFMIRSHDILNPLNHVVNVFCFSLPFSLYFMFAFAFGYTCYIAWMGVEYIYHKDLVSISPKQQQQ